MARFTMTCTSSWSQPDAFDYLCDMRNAHRWDPGVASANLVGQLSVPSASAPPASVSPARRADPAPELGGGPPTNTIGCGTTFDVTLLLAGRRRLVTYTVADYQRPCHAVLEADDPVFRSVDTITVQPAEAGGIQVDYDAELEPAGAWKAISPLIAIAFRRIGQRASIGLARELGR